MMVVFRKRLVASAPNAAPVPPAAVAAIDNTPSALPDVHTQVINLGKINASQLQALENSGIHINYDVLLQKLRNPALTHADFQAEYPWQAQFFIATQDELTRIYSDKSPITGQVAKDPYGPRIPFYAAALADNVEAMDFYLAAHEQAHPNKSPMIVQEALYYAARGASPAAMQYLIGKGADPTKLNKYSSSIIHCAAASGDVVTMQMAAAYVKNAGLNKDGESPLHIAIRSNSLPAVEYCLNILQLPADAKAKDMAGAADPMILKVVSNPKPASAAKPANQPNASVADKLTAAPAANLAKVFQSVTVN